MPEVGGDAVVYCDPQNIESISDAIDRVVNEEEVRRELEGRACGQAAKFSYAKAAKETLEIYQSYAG